MGALEDKAEALARGITDTGLAGWGDELAARLLGKLPQPKDPEGYTRNYGAGSMEKDYENVDRGNNADLAAKYPETFHSGQNLGMVPGLIALLAQPELSVAGAGLAGGARGAVSGAGHADNGNRLEGAARQAGPAAAAAMLGSMVPEAVEGAKGMFGGGGGGPMAPALAGAQSAEVNMVKKGSEPAQVQANFSVMRPPAGEDPIPAFPKPGKTISESDLPMYDEMERAADNMTSSANKRLVERSIKNKAGKPINRDAEYAGALAADKEAGVARRAADEEADEVSGIMTKPGLPKRKNAKDLLGDFSE